MPGPKRKYAGGRGKTGGTKAKKLKTNPSTNGNTSTASTKLSKSQAKPTTNEDIIESDTTEDENGFYGFSANDTSVKDQEDFIPLGDSDSPPPLVEKKPYQTPLERKKAKNKLLDEHGHLKSTSKEAHAQQKAIAKQRKAAKPNADMVARSKELWERLRRKSHVPPEERKELVNELFELVTGRVKEFVFKHDSTRVIQCALKYANVTQRKNIAIELKGDYLKLAESKYGKHMVAKLIVEGYVGSLHSTKTDTNVYSVT